jgi:hypothetical protein
VLTGLCFPFFFSAAFNTKKMMPACCEFVLGVLFFVQECLQRWRQWRGQFSVYAGFLSSPSLCVLFLSLGFCFVFALFLLWFYLCFFDLVFGFPLGFSFFSFFFFLKFVFIVSESLHVWETKFQSNSFSSLKFEFD